MKRLLFAVLTAATSQASLAASYDVVANCGDPREGLRVRVIDFDVGGPAIYVYRNGLKIAAKWADRRVIENSAAITRVGYSSGASAFDGGIDLRIRTRDERIPANEGTAHLTLELDGAVANERLRCSIY